MGLGNCAIAAIVSGMLGSSSLVLVRDARLADAPALTALFRETWEHTYRGIIPHVHLESMIRRRGLAWWRTTIRSRDTLLLLEFNGQAVGYATCGAARSRGDFKSEIYELYLLPDFQGLGFGEHLFEACRHSLDEQRLRSLMVWALAQNEAAVSFYYRRGGRPVATTYERLGGARLEKIAFGWAD